MIAVGETTMKALVTLPRDPSACWKWNGCVRADNGVAIKQFAGRCVPARRWLWEQLFGRIPRGMVIAQACGNPSCVNPYHLKRTTLADAMRDGLSATLTQADAYAIRQSLKEYEDQQQGKRKRRSDLARRLARDYGVEPGSIYAIWRGDTWKGHTKHHAATSPSEARL